MSALNELMVSDAQVVRKVLTDNNLTPTLLARYAREQGDARFPKDIISSYRDALEGKQPQVQEMSDFLNTLCANLEIVRGRFSQIEWKEVGTSYVAECRGHRAIVEHRRTGYAVTVFDEEGKQPCSWPKHMSSLDSAKDRALVMLNASIEKMEGAVPLMKVF